jgi:hypothetical protein
MKKLIAIMAFLALFASGFCMAAGTNFGSNGPAPNSGDGVPDGSGFDGSFGPDGIGTPGSGSGPQGPAPNSGDGVPDGSGF